MAKCVACAKFMSTKDGITCPKCSSSTHRECVGIPVGVVVNDKWRCGVCQTKKPKGRDPATPIRSIQDSTFLPTAGALSTECELFSRDAFAGFVVEMRTQFESMKSELLLEFQSFKEELREVRSVVCELKSDITAINKDMTVAMSRISVLENNVSDLENYLGNSRNTVSASELEKTVVGLKTALNDSEQETLLYDLEIAGLPEQKEENLSDLIPLLADKIGIIIENRDVISIERFGLYHTEHQTTTLPVKPRKVFIRFSRRLTRDICLQRARERRGLTSTELGLEGPPARLFFNERLTRYNRQLLAKSREQCRLHQWRYCWTKGGRIYLRKEDGSAAVRIQIEEDLSVVFL